MAEEHEEHEVETPDTSSSGKTFLIVALAVIAFVGAAFGFQQRKQVSQLAEHEQTLNAQVSVMQKKLDIITAAMATPAPAPEASAPAAATPAANQNAPATRTAAPRPSATDRRVRQLQAKLEEQEKQLAETRAVVDLARTDLEGRLVSTRDELNGSIARTSEEVALLQRRGASNYFEFDLTKAKKYEQVGPIGLQVRRTDAKRKNFDIRLLVDDNQLEKKRVNLYEPVWIHRSDDPHPVQLVVFSVTKNRLQGYIMVPRYRQSELVAASAPQPPEH